MDKEDVLRERINSLIDNELLSVEMLQEATGIEKDSLEKFLFENGVKLSSDDMKDSQTVNSHERTRYQPNPIYARQANEIESVAKTVAEQSRTIEAFKAERDKLGMFKGKEKKEIQGKIDNFERLRRSNLDKLKALGVSNLSKADEAAKEKRTLAAQEQEKAQAARRNEGAGSRAEEAKQVFLEAAKRIPADQRQAVLERMEQYNSHEAGGMEVFKAEIEARRVLDSALKEQTQDREHEKTKVKGRGRTD